MDFRVLGPLEVDDGGRRLLVRGAKQRALLGALLARTNEVVSEDRLLDELWGGEPPASGRAALRVRVSQLRKALGAAGRRLETRAPGYVLELGPDELDARRFERLAAAGAAALQAGDPRTAGATLRDALALWRGPAFADLAYADFARGEIVRLEELRLAALEDRIEADLAVGRHAELVGELEALVAANPHRERLCAQLMLALYRSGRQADALAAFRTARSALVAELGLDPGPALQSLERAILRQDPALELPGAPPAGEPVAGEERKLVTVLAAALAAPAADDAERAAETRARFRACATAEVEAAGGRVEAVVGDAVTTAFGVPVAQEDHAGRALHAALALRRALDREGLPVRIGVASAEAVVGRRDSGVVVESAAVGTATALAQAAGAGEIHVDERTVAGAHGAFEFRAAERPGARRLLRALSVTRAPAGELVGRERELDALRAAYARCVADDAPVLVTVAGDAGVGKSRLVGELRAVLAHETPEPRRRTGRCLPYGRGVTYQPLADVLREELELVETDEPAAILARLGGDAVLGLTLGLDVERDLHPLEARRRLEEAWSSLLGRLAAEQPVVVLVEDLHWAQDALLDLLERLVSEVAGPLLLVGTARPELFSARPAWGRHRRATTVWLEPLAPDDAGRLLGTLARGRLEEGVRALLLERAEGNPFFLEELAQAAPFTSGVPDSIQAVVAARIDLLPPTEKAALQAASVIGRVFWRGPVRELLEGVIPDFATLEARDFVRRRSGSALPGEPEFAFKHALTRDVAYASLTAARRARLHAAFADWLAAAGGGRDEHAAFLAHHYAEAVRPDDADLVWPSGGAEHERLRGEAVAWLRRAAELALRRYELDGAVAMLHRALQLDPDDAARLELWRRIGRAHALRHDGPRFLQAMEQAIALTSDRGARAELYAELSLETALRAGMWRRRPERAVVDGWIEQALELAEAGTAARAKALIARCTWAPSGSAAAAREASAIADRLGDAELRSYAWDARGITLWIAGEPDLARAWEERRFELLDRIRDPDHVADIHYAPVTGCVWHGYFGEARRLAARHDEIVGRLTPHHRIHGIAVLAEVEELAGEWTRVADLEPRAEAVIVGNVQTPCVRSPRTLLLCAVAAERLGDADQARRLEEAADAFAMEGYGHVLDTPRIRLALARGRLDLVDRLVAEPLPDRGWHRAWLLLSTWSTRLDALAALGRRREIEAWPRVRRGTYLEPFLLRALGRVREDETLVERAANGFERLRLDVHARETRALPAVRAS